MSHSALVDSASSQCKQSAFLRWPIQHFRFALRFLVACTLIASGLLAHGQSNEWSWEGGYETPVPPVYGTKGTPSAANIPGARELASTWTDSNGNLWMFGGNGADAAGRWTFLNDLWEYTPSSRQWTWVGGDNSPSQNGGAAVYGTEGVPAAGNIPGAREGAGTWKDPKGNLWLFGGSNYEGGTDVFNDLWKFDPASSEWTWVSGSNQLNSPGVYGTLGVAASSNVPTGRANFATWADAAGTLWMFGGSDTYGYKCWNDLWRYSIATNQWAWMGGSSTPVSCDSSPQGAVYGTKGVPAATNQPGPRYGASAWTDQQGNFWLFGGFGTDSAGVGGFLNDLWEYSPSSGQWTWMSGSSTFPANCTQTIGSNSNGCFISGSYGVLQTADPSNVPGSRSAAVAWTDSKGNFWLFGGFGHNTDGKWAFFNDLWMYSPGADLWTWMGGSSSLNCAYLYCGEPGIYGTMNTPALGNAPPARFKAVGWTDANGNFWLFGGSGIDVTGTQDDFQDLWEFQPNTNGQPVVATPAFSPEPGSYTSVQTVSISDTTPNATIYYLVNGTTPAIEYTGPLTLSTSVSIEAIALASGYANSNIASATYSLNIPAAAQPVFAPASGDYPSAQTVAINEATAGATIYYTTDGSLPTTNSTVYSGPVTVSSSQVITAVAVAPGFLASATASAVYTIGADQHSGLWSWMGGSSESYQTSHYGTLGTPSSANMPGARTGAATWSDASGNLWLFGGQGSDYGFQNDLWKFTPGTQQWVWVSGNDHSSQPVYGTLGTPAATNIPGGRYGAATWTDSSGHEWIFGGYGVDASGTQTALNDLWEYDPSANQWAWIGGSSTGLPLHGAWGQPGVYGILGQPSANNMPGSRYGAAAWADTSGNFWLFGGYGLDASGYTSTLNDFWRYSPSTGEWTWMGGSNAVNVLVGTQASNYGTRGVGAPGNFPGSRYGATAWTDSSGNFWLFGGNSTAQSLGYLNELWKYNPSSNLWTWVSGLDGRYCQPDPIVGGYSACSTPPSTYGTLGVPGQDNTPGGGAVLASWKDLQGNFWMLGGESSDVTGQSDGFYLGNTNALWMFNPTSQQWTWMGGDFATSNCFWVHSIFLFPFCAGPQGVYGSMGVPAVGNIPGGRTGASTWTDKNGTLWLFGGAMDGLDLHTHYMNDLWQYQPSPATLPAAAVPIFSLIPGTYVSGGPLTIANGMSNGQINYTTDGTPPTSASSVFSTPLNLSSMEAFQAIGTAPGYRNSLDSAATYTFASTPALPAFSVPSGTYTSVQSVAITEATPNSTIYYTTDGTVPVPTSPVYTGPLTVSSSETVTALAVAFGNSVTYGIQDPVGALVGPSASASYVIDLPPTAVPAFSIPGGNYAAPQTVTITDATPNATICFTTDGTTPTASSSAYIGPIAVSHSETIQAIAVAPGYASSPIASAAYVIGPPPTFSVGVSPGSVTVNSGSQVTIGVSVIPQSGFNAPVTFACSGLPAGATCSFSPASVTPSGGNSTTTQLTIAVAAQSAALHLRGVVSAAAFGCMFLFGFVKKRRRLQCCFALAVMLLSLGIASGCGGGSSGGGTGSGKGQQPVTTVVTVVATSGSLQQQATFSLTVN